MELGESQNLPKREPRELQRGNTMPQTVVGPSKNNRYICHGLTPLPGGVRGGPFFERHLDPKDSSRGPGQAFRGSLLGFGWFLQRQAFQWTRPTWRWSARLAHLVFIRECPKEKQNQPDTHLSVPQSGRPPCCLVFKGKQKRQPTH